MPTPEQVHDVRTSCRKLEAIVCALRFEDLWPKIDGRNLHPYRLKVKELRHIIELAADPEKTLIESLGEVKDSIGEWHDWCELESIAADVVDDDRNTRQQIHAIAEEKFGDAMAVTNRVQRRYFASDRRQGRKKRSGPISLTKPALDAAAKMAA